MRVLDLFCGAGGAAMGLHQQWPEAEIIGVDIKEQPLYPFEMVVANAMDYPLSGFDFIWTSPPCQGYTLMRNLGKTAGHGAPKLIEDIRARLHLTSAPWVIENVVGAPLITPLRLCGSSFGLRVQRHRLFECNFHTSALPCNHRGERPVPVWGDGRLDGLEDIDPSHPTCLQSLHRRPVRSHASSRIATKIALITTAGDLSSLFQNLITLHPLLLSREVRRASAAFATLP